MCGWVLWSDGWYSLLRLCLAKLAVFILPHLLNLFYVGPRTCTYMAVHVCFFPAVVLTLASMNFVINPLNVFHLLLTSLVELMI